MKISGKKSPNYNTIGKSAVPAQVLSGQWDLVVESQTDTHSKQPQLLGDGLRYK